jgi:gamma-glutamyltranspeptidase / glutathione hydrolase
MDLDVANDRRSPFFFASRRSPVFARGGMAAASQPLAVDAGLAMLKMGGTAADAAVAMAAALAVLEPCSTGLGGDAFALFYDGSTKNVEALNGSGRSPAALNLDLVRKHGYEKELDPQHAFTITVPGSCAAWCDLLEKHGSLDRSVVLAPAIRFAREGFCVGPVTAELWARGEQTLLETSEGGRELLVDGHAPRAGDVITNPGLARTLGLIAQQGKEGFYQGEIAEKIAVTVQQYGGVMTADDLAAHTSDWVTAASTVYRGVRVFECPPNGQGLAALIGLNILSASDFAAGSEPHSTQRLHYMIEAMRLAFADVRRYVADPEHSPAPVEELLSADYAAERAGLIDPNKASPDQSCGRPLGSSDTVYFSVVDGFGNACSMVNSVYMNFGSGIVPKGTGLSLQNRGHNFSLDPNHPNVLAPSKRSYHTIIPGMATREDDGSLFASFGVMGGFMQPQGHVQVLSAMLDDGLDPQAALDRCRFCIVAGEASGVVGLEEGINDQILHDLAVMGHDVDPVQGYERSLFGRGQIILRDPKTGVLCAGSDPRADGCAFGY